MIGKCGVFGTTFTIVSINFALIGFQDLRLYASNPFAAFGILMEVENLFTGDMLETR